MLYTVRFRLKESLVPKDMVEVNRLIDTKIIPAATAVAGVRSITGYQSINGELVLILIPLFAHSIPNEPASLTGATAGRVQFSQRLSGQRRIDNGLDPVNERLPRLYV